jgi:hypothetical protein
MASSRPSLSADEMACPCFDADQTAHLPRRRIAVRTTETFPVTPSTRANDAGVQKCSFRSHRLTKVEGTKYS